MKSKRVEKMASQPFNTWPGCSTSSASSSGRGDDDGYLYVMRQEISRYQALRTDESWLRLRKSLEERQILGSIAWINEKLSPTRSSWSLTAPKANFPIRKLTDLDDGVLTILLLECLYKCELKKELNCRLRLHKIRNFDTCLTFMRTSRRCECVGIQAYDLADCVNVKIMLGFLFLVKHDFEAKYANEMVNVRIPSNSEQEVERLIQLEQLSKVDSVGGKMEDSGLNMGLDNEESIGSAHAADEPEALFESSSDSSSILSLTGETLREQPKNEDIEVGLTTSMAQDSAYSDVTACHDSDQMTSASSTSSTDSIMDELAYDERRKILEMTSSSPVRQLVKLDDDEVDHEKPRASSITIESFLDQSNDEVDVSFASESVGDDKTPDHELDESRAEAAGSSDDAEEEIESSRPIEAVVEVVQAEEPLKVERIKRVPEDIEHSISVYESPIEASSVQVLKAGPEILTNDQLSETTGEQLDQTCQEDSIKTESISESLELTQPSEMISPPKPLETQHPVEPQAQIEQVELPLVSPSIESDKKLLIKREKIEIERIEEAARPVEEATISLPLNVASSKAKPASKSEPSRKEPVKVAEKITETTPVVPTRVTETKPTQSNGHVGHVANEKSLFRDVVKAERTVVMGDKKEATTSNQAKELEMTQKPKHQNGSISKKTVHECPIIATADEKSPKTSKPKAEKEANGTVNEARAEKRTDKSKKESQTVKTDEVTSKKPAQKPEPTRKETVIKQKNGNTAATSSNKADQKLKEHLNSGKIVEIKRLTVVDVLKKRNIIFSSLVFALVSIMMYYFSFNN